MALVKCSYKYNLKINWDKARIINSCQISKEYFLKESIEIVRKAKHNNVNNPD